MKLLSTLVIIGTLIAPTAAWATQQEGAAHESNFPLVFLFVITMLLAGRVGALAERFRQPAVLGELLMGVLLAAIALLPGLHGIIGLTADPLVVGIAEIGVLLLLFRTGLESNIHEMKRVGVKALIVAVVGVTLPFVGGFAAAKLLMPGLDNNVYLFLGATLTATSVGITARVFKDLNVLKSLEAQIVLGAAVIDDILGLLILAIVGGIVSAGHIEFATVAVLCIKALAFLAGAIVIGQLAAPRLGRFAAGIHGGVGMKMALALGFCAAFSYAASALAGLAPIVGAFAAGLILDPVHFNRFAAPQLTGRIRDWAARLKGHANAEVLTEMEEVAHREEHAHVENLIEGISNFFVPIFFVYTGLQVNLHVFADLKTVFVALIITAVAFVGKVACGYAAGKGLDHKLIGFGMVPRGEVGLIFLNVGKGLGVVTDQIFAIGVIMVILSTLLTPPILSAMIQKKQGAARA
jgi:Kef-type K+ transport system membrane component KefB